jgi:hypothetical protein
MAADILDGSLVLKPSRRQLANLLNVSAAYIAVAAQLSPEKRKAIIAGRDDTTSFARLLNPSAKQLALPAPTIVDDATLVSIVRVGGVDRTLNAAALVEAAQ